MSLTTRIYIFEDDGSIWLLPRRVAGDLARGLDRLPQFSDRRIRVAEILLETHAGKPVRIVHSVGGYWTFDSKGLVQQDLAESACMARMTYDGLREDEQIPGVVSLAELNRRRWHARYRWDLTPRDINRIIHVIWPETAGGKREKVGVVQGHRRPRRPMTYEAKEALDNIRSLAIRVESALEGLTRGDLKALSADLTNELESCTPLEREVLRGVAAAVEWQQAVVRARSINKGPWYAIAELSRWSERRDVANLEELEAVECKSKNEAIAAAQELLRKHADYFGEHTTVEVRVEPEIVRTGKVPNS